MAIGRQDKVLKNIRLSLTITTVSSLIAIIIFVVAYFYVKNVLLLIFSVLAALALIFFHRVARRIEYNYKQTLKEAEQAKKEKIKE